MTPELLNAHIGRGMYAPAAALGQLVSNSFDAGASRILIELEPTQLGDGVAAILIEDDGHGMTEEWFDHAFLEVGRHFDGPATLSSPFKAFGSRGIGRFAVFSLGYRAEWETTAETVDGRRRLSWTMSEGLLEIDDLEDAAVDAVERTGTRIRIVVRPDDAPVQRFVSSPATLMKELLYRFAGRLLREENQTRIFVSGELLDADASILERQEEQIPPDEEAGRPQGSLAHLVVDQRMRLDFPAAIYVTGEGWTYESIPLRGVALDNAKYAGYLESPMIAEHGSTAKDQLAADQPGIEALVSYARERATAFLMARREARREEWIEQARKHESYPFREPSSSSVDVMRQTVYDRVLLLMNEVSSISDAPEQVQGLLFKLVLRVLDGNDDLVTVLTDILGLDDVEVRRFAEVLRRTNLPSIIRVAGMVIDRVRFLDELNEILYRQPSLRVRERTQLQPLLEANTWMFGERFHLVSADQRISTLVEKARADLRTGFERADSDADASRTVSADERLVPDLYLAQSCREGDLYTHT